MKTCKLCGGSTNVYGAVTLMISEEEGPITFCNQCHNKYMAEMLDVTNTDGFNQKLVFVDGSNIPHTFQINSQINPLGIQWEAVEFLEDNKIGYLFRIYQEFEEEYSVALKRLYDKIEKGLSQEFIIKEECFGREYYTLKNDRAEGRIEWDDAHDGDIPKLIIDGKEYSLYELGRMMMAYEGWNFKLEIIEPGD